MKNCLYTNNVLMCQKINNILKVSDKKTIYQKKLL
jgi:hypothetical protein